MFDSTGRRGFSMRLLPKLLPSVTLMFLLSCTTEPETKKASFNLKEACKNGTHYKTGGSPTKWSATIRWKGSDGNTRIDQVDIAWDTSGFKLPCGYGVQGDPSPILTIIYD